MALTSNFLRKLLMDAEKSHVRAMGVQLAPGVEPFAYGLHQARGRAGCLFDGMHDEGDVVRPSTGACTHE